MKIRSVEVELFHAD